MEKKITKREVINMMLAEEVVKSNPTYKDYLTHEIELLDKKSTNRKPTQTQKENEAIKSVIETVLRKADKPMTSTEILTTLQNEYSELKVFSNQKITAMVKQMIDEGKVEKNIDGKKSVFSIK